MIKCDNQGHENEGAEGEENNSGFNEENWGKGKGGKNECIKSKKKKKVTWVLRLGTEEQKKEGMRRKSILTRKRKRICGDLTLMRRNRWWDGSKRE